MSKSNKFIFNLFLGLIFFFTLSYFWGTKTYEFRDTFAYKTDHSLSFFANFDGVHYIQIAENGYKSAGGIQAFFPLYPLLVKILSFITQNYLISATIISWSSFLASLFIFYKLLKLDYQENSSRQTMVFLVFFATSFYFLSVYTESLFLFLTLSFFYSLRKGNYYRSIIFGIFASATRLTGIFLIPAFIYEIWINNQNNQKKENVLGFIKKYWITITPSLGLLAFMLYLKLNFHDPLLFVHVQSGFGAGRETGKFILFYQVFWRYLKMFFTVNINNPIFLTFSLEFFYTCLFVGLLIYAYFKKVRRSYLIYSSLSLILPTLTGTLSSMPRYVLVLFPAFISLSLIKNKFIKYAIFIINLIFLFINTALFTQGYWVS